MSAAGAPPRKGVRIIADGGIAKSGDIVKALTLADAVICGGLFAGCREAPGEILEINGKLYKQYRGMGTLAAMKAGSAARYGHEKEDTTRKISAEGIEALKEVSGSVDNVLADLIGGLQSGMGYLGARTLRRTRDQGPLRARHRRRPEGSRRRTTSSRSPPRTTHRRAAGRRFWVLGFEFWIWVGRRTPAPTGLRSALQASPATRGSVAGCPFPASASGFSCPAAPPLLPSWQQGVGHLRLPREPCP